MTGGSRRMQVRTRPECTCGWAGTWRDDRTPGLSSDEEAAEHLERRHDARTLHQAHSAIRFRFRCSVCSTDYQPDWAPTIQEAKIPWQQHKATEQHRLLADLKDSLWRAARRATPR